mmetsp:Transcript_7541/g.14749  ORF Transcript_7541/g.14749 Transcript_7541/m.14749 type:complete len:201 (-) Transcript_7541:567-1169(-)
MQRESVEGLNQIEASHVKVKGTIIVNGRPCVVKKASFAKPGKHGHIKCSFTCQDLIRPDKKSEYKCPGHERVEIPEVEKYELFVQGLSAEEDENMMEVVTAFETKNEDGEKCSVPFEEDNELHEKAVEMWHELREAQEGGEGEGEKKREPTEDVVLSIIQATVKKGKSFAWQHRIEGCALKKKSKSAKKPSAGRRRRRRR